MLCDDVSLLCVQMQTNIKAARGGLRKTLRQKTASSDVNACGIFGDRDRNNELTRLRTVRVWGHQSKTCNKVSPGKPQTVHTLLGSNCQRDRRLRLGKTRCNSDVPGIGRGQSPAATDFHACVHGGSRWR